MPNLALHEIARTPNHSVRPDLWPAYAWVPALGCQGSTLWDLASDRHAILTSGAPAWGTDEIIVNGDNYQAPAVGWDVNGPWSIVAQVRDSSGTDGERPFYTQLSITGIACRITVGIYDGKPRFLMRNMSGINIINFFNKGPNINDNLYHTLCFTIDYNRSKGQTNVDIGYVDGETITISSDVADRGLLTHSTAADIGYSWIGGIRALYILPGVFLTRQQALDLGSDILFPFRRRDVTPYWVLDEVPPSFNFAWATGNNHVIGAA